VTIVANLEMTIYVGGVETKLVWRDEAEYQRARKFLSDRGAVIAPSDDGRKQISEYVYLDNKAEFQALLNHMRPLNRS
jgi:hypothetical protein